VVRTERKGTTARFGQNKGLAAGREMWGFMVMGWRNGSVHLIMKLGRPGLANAHKQVSQRLGTRGLASLWISPALSKVTVPRTGQRLIPTMCAVRG